MRLSIISIAYNNLAGLKKTLAVFKEGQFSNSIELVIVDGGSNDGTSEFLKEQSITQNWVSERDKGIYNAMNKGLNMAKGDYVWFLNSGDFAYNTESVSNLLEILETNPDAVYSETMMVDADEKELGTRSNISTRPLPEMLNWKSFRMGMNVSHQSFVIKRELALPYDESYRYVSDIDWMIKCLKTCKKVQKSEKILACFTLDGFSSKHRKASNKERFKVLQKHYGFLPNLISHIQIVIRKILKPSGL